MIGAASFRNRFAALPGGVRGALWMSAGSLFFAMIYVVIRRLTETVPIQELVRHCHVNSVASARPVL